MEQPTITKSKKGVTDPEFNEGHAHCFCDMTGIVHCEFVSPNTMVNSDFYCEVLRHLRENVQRQRPELWHNQNWVLHHDNVPARTSLKTTEFVTNNMVIIPYPPLLAGLRPM
jgi:hypothetical protein